MTLTTSLEPELHKLLLNGILFLSINMEVTERLNSAETHTISVIFLRTNNIFVIYINSLIVDFRIIYNFYFLHFSLLFEKYKDSVEVRVQ